MDYKLQGSCLTSRIVEWVFSEQSLEIFSEKFT